MESTFGMRQMVLSKDRALKEAARTHFVCVCVPTSVCPTVPAGHHPRATAAGRRWATETAGGEAP